MGNCNEKQKLIEELADNVGALYNNMKIMEPAINDLADVINLIHIGNVCHVSVIDRDTIKINAEKFVDLTNAINHCVDVNAPQIEERLKPEIFRELLDVTISSKEDTWPKTVEELEKDLKKTSQCVDEIQNNTDKYITGIEKIKVQLKKD